MAERVHTLHATMRWQPHAETKADMAGQCARPKYVCQTEG